MKTLLLTVVLLVLVVPVMADSLFDELIPDESSVALMIGKDANLKAKAVASWELFGVNEHSLFIDVWNLEPVGAGLSTDIRETLRIGAGYDGQRESLVGYMRQVITW